MEQIFLSLGSNLGDRAAHLRQAIARLRELAEVTAISSVYESEPVEFTAQPSFLNMAVEMRVDSAQQSDTPELWLGRLLEIERAMGRVRQLSAPKGPRIIDLDMLLFGARVVSSPTLTLPHPAMQQRRFVLEPLAEIAPDFVHPALHKSIRQLLAELPAEGPAVRRLGKLDDAEWRPTSH